VRVFGRLLALIEVMPDERLADAERVEWFVKPRWGERRALWECIADDSFRHYQQHVGDLERWVNRTTDETDEG
jgi:hypothetical protein